MRILVHIRPGLLLFLAGCIMLSACRKEEAENRLCDAPPAGAALRFRIVDSSGKDYLHVNQRVPDVVQPCRVSPLVPVFFKYEIPQTTDSGVLIHFLDMRTPPLGEGAACFRITFDWGSEKDTLDWRYREDETEGCIQHVIEYVRFKGKDAPLNRDGRYTYFVLTK